MIRYKYENNLFNLIIYQATDVFFMVIILFILWTCKCVYVLYHINYARDNFSYTKSVLCFNQFSVVTRNAKANYNINVA